MLYYGLKRLPKTKKKRAVAGLQRLRKQLSRDVPAKDSENSLLLATWNIRDLTKTKKRRLDESLYYIAEIISRFDIVAVQEVNGLEEWLEIMRILGREWDFIASDEASRASGGNGERLTYVFDRRKVNFQSIAGEIVLPEKMLISEGDGKKGTRQFARTPYVALFQSGWFKFSLCTVHIFYGADSGQKLARRVSEITEIAKYFGKKADKELKKDERALILLGDFNIISPEHKTMAALEDQGFIVPASLKNKPSNQGKTKHYDQIAFMADADLLEFVDRVCLAPNQCNSGVFDPFESVFQLDDASSYPEKGSTRQSFKNWRSYQISDHLPMWTRLDVNDSDEYIDSLL